MKKLLLITAVLFTGLSYSQDIDLLTTLNGMDNITAEALSKKLLNQAPVEYQLLKASNKRLVYIPNGLNKADFNPIKDADKAIVIDFYIKEDNGLKTLKLKRITGGYDASFSIWKTFFKPNADVKVTMTDYGSQRMRLNAYKYTFRKELGYGSNVWTISNQS